ncbi:Trafficking protein particle complex subunit 3 [Bonamia ostreae]|uniref:Trafficking protein particle complex subunit 3 n=1 Tax=Bonamia ostreae TaxID=126728 RepID=A0ABV2AT79_9EUKA
MAKEETAKILKKTGTISADLFILTYGSLVIEIIKEYDDNIALVNHKLFSIGENMGKRMCEEFLLLSENQNCSSFKESVDVIAKTALKVYLGTTAEVKKTENPNVFVMFLEHNPLEKYLNLPESKADLVYSNVVPGVIRGALSAIGIQVDCRIDFEQTKKTGETIIIVNKVK